MLNGALTGADRGPVGQKKTAGLWAPPSEKRDAFDYWNRRNTAWSACEAIDRAVVDSD